MFTPPSSPLPPPSKSSSTTPPSLTLDPNTPSKDSGCPVLNIPPSAAMSTKTPYDAKKRIGRRILLLVAVIPALLVLSASLRHLLPLFIYPPPIPFTKRDAILLDVSTTNTSASTAPSSTEVQSTSSPVPTIPSNLAPPSPFPQPYDSGTLSANFSTVGCEAYFSNFTQNQDFRQCRAFSFLLNASSAFLEAQRNLTLLNNLIWAMCNTPITADECSRTMSNYLSGLNTACSKDIGDGVQPVLQAQIGFASYSAMRAAVCLHDPATNSYCYEEAIAETTPSDVYYYQLPIGSEIPTNVMPSCSACLKSVLAVYAEYAGVRPGSGITPTSTGENSTSDMSLVQLPVLSKVYPAVARAAVNKCGGAYASVGIVQSGTERTLAISWGAAMLGLAAFVLI